MAEKQTIQDRAIKSYPPQKYVELVKAYALTNELTESKVVTLALKDFFNRMTESERKRLFSKHSY